MKSRTSVITWCTLFVVITTLAIVALLTGCSSESMSSGENPPPSTKTPAATSVATETLVPEKSEMLVLVVALAEPINGSGGTPTSTEIWKMSEDGSDKELVVRVPLDVNDSPRHLVVSPDKSKFVLETLERSNAIFDVEGNLIHSFKGGDASMDFSWSSKSDAVVYYRGGLTGEHGIFMFNLETNLETQLVSSQEGIFDRSPALSPSGDKLVILEAGLHGLWTVVTVNIEGVELPLTGEDRANGVLNPEFRFVVSGVATHAYSNPSFVFQWITDNQFVFGSAGLAPVIDTGQSPQPVDRESRTGVYLVDLRSDTAYILPTSDLPHLYQYQEVVLSHSGGKILFADDGIYILDVSLRVSHDIMPWRDTGYFPFSLGWSGDDSKVLFVDYLDIVVLDAENGNILHAETFGIPFEVLVLEAHWIS